MKRTLSLFFAVLLACASVFALPLAAKEPLPAYSKHYGVYNIENNTVCLEKNIDEKVYPASTAKIMAAVVACEYYKENYNTKITVKAEWLADVVGHTVGIAPGEKLSARDLIGMLVVSNANDAAYVLAGAICGNVDDFVALMNNKATTLGMDNTKYINPTGVDGEGACTTVRDVMTLSSYAISLSLILDVAGARNIGVEATNTSNIRTLYNRNYFCSNYYNPNYVNTSVIGLNSGKTSGSSLVVVGRNSAGLTYVVVVMDARDATEEEQGEDNFYVGAYEDAELLLDWAYDAYGYTTVLHASDMVCEVPVKLSGKVDHVILLPEYEVVEFLSVDVDVKQDVTKEFVLYEEVLEAPLSKGQAVGEMTVFVNGKELETVKLVCKNNVERSNWLLFTDKIVRFFTHPLAIVIEVLLAAFVVWVLIVQARRYKNKNRTVRYRNYK